MVKNKKILTDVRKVVIIGNGKGVTLPKEWLEKNKIKVGDPVIIKVEKLKIK